MHTECKKLVQVLNYIAEKSSGKIQYNKAVSLLYLLDRFYLRTIASFVSGGIWYLTDATLTNSALRDLIKGADTCQEMIEYAKEYLDINYTEIQSRKPFNREECHCFDMEAMTFILEQFNNFTAVDLQEFIAELPEIAGAGRVYQRIKSPVRIATSAILKDSTLDYILLKKFALKNDPFYQPEQVLMEIRKHARV